MLEVVEWLAGQVSLEIHTNNITQELIFLFLPLNCPAHASQIGEWLS